MGRPTSREKQTGIGLILHPQRELEVALGKQPHARHSGDEMANAFRGNDLITYIFDCKKHELSEVLRGWLATCARFETFADRYKEKIRKKVRSAATADELTDLRFELEVPYLLLCDMRFEVEYEKYGSGPDFSVPFKREINFNVEVKRIREATAGARFDNCMDGIIRRIEALPSSLAFWLDAPEMEYKLDLGDRLEGRKDDIISFIVDKVRSEENKLLPDSHHEYPIPGFEGGLVLDLTKPAHKRDSGTSYHGGTRPIFYTQNEHRKFGDVILESLRQLMPEMINVLFIGSNSSTHEDRDILMAVDSINRNLRRREENFFSRRGFTDKQDFLRQSRKLSGIWFRSIWVSSSAPEKDRNFLWLNAGANHPISEETCKYLREMTGRHRPLINEDLSS